MLNENLGYFEGNVIWYFQTSQYIDLVCSLRDLTVVLKIIPWVLYHSLSLQKCCQNGVRNEARKSHKNFHMHIVSSVLNTE